ncbi:hypothetical protein GOB46_21285 [Sinorhizobium meliloti]|nr:hypothetical protein [Sinorhizobium meliloti]MDW9483165.1 hypothetical protein [Sinorhizobium meliloti]MDW9512432.1 hypothetical protein [Sinorhizobium meliloti]MDW9594578.1 hypothetical protein [Sinorhizobium meliloti]MDW9667897.1 hypothetical protein [Sinorhizobium meliloti]
MRSRTCGDALCRSARLTSQCHVPQGECRGLPRFDHIFVAALDHDVFRSGRPKNMNVIDTNSLSGMRAENRTHFSSSRSKVC